MDTGGAPSTKSSDYRMFGIGFLLFGTMAGGFGALGTFRERDEPGEDPPWPGREVG